jgi:predicted SprT family Zn-dependent metalloprotease
VKYHLDAFPLEDFTRADSLVRATILASGRVDQWNSVRLVTSDLNRLPKSDRDRVASAASKDGTFFRACCLPCTHNQYESDLWFNPAVVDGSDRFRATVLHELCHVHVGVSAGHGDRWRRLYARVLYHYHFEVSPINHWHSLVTLANWSYTKRSRSESTGQFMRRINGDKEKWIRQANDEHDRVMEIWTRMTSTSLS